MAPPPALFTDLYQLTMAAAYVRAGVEPIATFSLFVRRLPPERGFLLAAGLEDVLEYLRSLRFTGDELGWLESLGLSDPAFLDRLRALRFTGEVRAMPEGTVVFADEPMLEITAPLVEAQLVESAVINLVQLPTLVASKAVRSVLAAAGRGLAEFGLRRSHGADAAMKAARAAWIAGFDSTSNVLAGKLYGIPLSGTMAHSFVNAFDDEIDAFRAYADAHPSAAVLLLDTYDTVAAAHKAAQVNRALAKGGQRLAGVRIDSGDLDELSRAVRRVLDADGAESVPIIASGGLDELDVARLADAGAPIDSFGLGTRIDTSADAPSLDLVYKLVRVGGRDVRKLSAGKATWAGPKAVYRSADAGGRFARDLLATAEEPSPADAEALLAPVMSRGEPLLPSPSLDAIRARARAQVAALPEAVRRLTDPASYPVEISPALRERQARVPNTR
jgi:nicotinate phosphoribosyltransferase